MIWVLKTFAKKSNFFTKKWLLERESKFPFSVWHDPHFIRSPTFAWTTPVLILRSPLSHWLQARADSGGPKCIHRSCITSKRLSLFCVTMPSSQVRQGILGKYNFCSNHKNYHLPGPHSHIVWKAPHCVSPPPQKNMSSVLSDILFTIRSMIFVQFQLNMDKRQTWTIEWKEANQSWSKLRQINKSSPQKNKQSTTPSKTSIRVF